MLRHDLVNRHAVSWQLVLKILHSSLIQEFKHSRPRPILYVQAFHSSTCTRVILESRVDRPVGRLVLDISCGKCKLTDLGVALWSIEVDQRATKSLGFPWSRS